MFPFLRVAVLMISVSFVVLGNVNIGQAKILVKSAKVTNLVSASSLFDPSRVVSASKARLPGGQVESAVTRPIPGISIQLSRSDLSMLSVGSATLDVTALPTGGAVLPANAAGVETKVASTLPVGISASWSKPKYTASGSVRWKLTLSGSTKTPVGKYDIQISGQALDSKTKLVYRSAAVRLNLSTIRPTLRISAVSSELTLVQNTAVAETVVLISNTAFNESASIDATGLPPGVSASWGEKQIPLAAGEGKTTLRLKATSTAKPGLASFIVTANVPGAKISKSFTVDVKQTPGLKVQITPSSTAISSSQDAAVVLIATPVGGVAIAPSLAGVIAKIDSEIPGGVTALLEEPTLTKEGSVEWKLKFAAISKKELSSYTLRCLVEVRDARTGIIYSETATVTFNFIPLATAVIGRTPGNTIPGTFMGLSHEWGTAQQIMGDSTTGVNPIYRQLLNNLTAFGSGPMMLRIGGNSTDKSGEPTVDVVQPFAELAKAQGAKFYLGVNLGSDDVHLAVDQAQAYLTQMPAGSLEAIEIGNEPDEYYFNGLRPADYDFQDYLSDFDTWRDDITPLLATKAQLMGAAWAQIDSLKNITPYGSAEHESLALFSQHYYAANACPGYPAIARDFLLTPGASTSGSAAVASSVKITHSYSLRFRIGETNSIWCGGVQGISNTFSSALWAVDTMFEYADVGVDGVNWHGVGGSAYDVFDFDTKTVAAKTTYTLSEVNPLYYGLLMFQEATGNDSHLMPVTLTTEANLKAWATEDKSETPHLVLINKEKSMQGIVVVTMTGYSEAKVMYLTAPSYLSTNGVKFAGQTFDGSPDGRIQGVETPVVIDGDSGVFQIPVSHTSAALITFVK